MTDYATKVNTLCDLVFATLNGPAWDDFKRANDLGLALAVAESGNLATVHDKGKKYVDQTYKMLLDVLSLDGEYASLSEIFDAAIANGAKTNDPNV